MDNMKHNNIHITGMPEGSERKQEIKSLFEEIKTKNVPSLVKVKWHTRPGNLERTEIGLH